jgi:hypothetical protein
MVMKRGLLPLKKDISYKSLKTESSGKYRNLVSWFLMLYYESKRDKLSG